MISFLNKTCTIIFTMIMLTLSVFWTGLPNTVRAESVRVMAVVNGQPITSLDFEERRNFLVNTTGIKITDDNRERINQDTLQMLIDDVIKKKKACASAAALKPPRANVHQNSSIRHLPNMVKTLTKS